ncbi:MAG: NHLP bacteriocin export ABC transporter permease/ATPase subunit [Planctomycetes bacterium RBG_13_63_9]|nr:MAG: NHLP bacteriocin export ABC transporter permease/ATPase subunit [Planctomycetes bacterium RBG_13_63_9]
MLRTWLELFFQHGTAREVAGNRPLVLDDPQRVGMVAVGHVDVFAVPLENGQPSGARVHVCRAEVGQLFFGTQPERATGLGLIAVGTPDSQVLELPRASLQELDGDPAELAALLDAWIEGLTAGVAHGRLAGHVSLLATEGDSRHEAGKSVTPAHGTYWICGTGLTVRFLGKIELSLPDAKAVFPLAGSGWLETADRTKVWAARSESLVTDSRLWPGLERFHQTVLSSAAASAREADEAELDRLTLKSRFEDQLMQSTLAQLASTVEPERTGDTLLLQQEDPLLAAFRLIGQRLGVPIKTPRDLGQRSHRDPISAIARASQLRTRRVLLSGDWWRQDNGPLLAFCGEENRPVALLPISTKSYELVDPTTGSRTPLTRAGASAVGSFAYCFYRSFPPRALSPREILRFSLAGTRTDWLTVVLLGLAGGLLGMLIPIATGVLFGRIIPAAEHFQLLWLVLILAVTAVVMTLFEFVQGVASVRLETRMNSSVEAGVWDRLLNLPAPFFRQYSTGDLAMRAMGIARIRQVLTDAAMSSVLTFVFSLVSFALLFYLDARLALLATLLFLIIAGVTCWAAVVQLRYERENHHVRGRVASIVLQLLTGISRLRVAGAERRALAFWAKSFRLQTKLGFQAQLVSNNASTFLATVPILTSSVIFGAVAFLGSEKLYLATFLAFNAAFVQIIAASVTVSSTVTSLLEIVPLYERAKPILVAEPEFNQDKREPDDLRGDIEISHVSFRYHDDGPLVLDDVSIHIRQGEFVAFVGPSGAGKSTILRLLLGFETPTTGSIYYDREDLARLDYQAVRRQMGVVLQNSQLTPGSILSNIVGSSLLTIEDAWEAARLSELDAEIAQMPMEMYTVITEGASTLSGGQRQRLMIARAVVSKPKILLFDEATSALDNVAQAKVAESLDNLKATRVVVAHRLSTIVNADRICVIDRGRVVQQGRYHDLMEQPGLFADLAKRQLA